MRAAVGWLTAESLLLLHDGKPLEAVRTQALGFAIARHAAQEPIPFAYYVACGIQAETLRRLNNILFVAGTNTTVANAVRAEVEQNRAHFTLAHGERGHLAIMMMGLESIRNTPIKEMKAWHTLPPIRNSSDLAALINRSKLLTIQQMRRLVAASERPYAEAPAAVEAALGDPTPQPNDASAFSIVTAWPFRSAPENSARLLAQEETVRAASALLVYKAAQSAFPDRLEAAQSAFPDRLEAALAPAPADPFGTGALGYRREGAGFVLYSVGKTGKYDGKGKPDSSNQEICLRYPPTANAPKRYTLR